MSRNPMAELEQTAVHQLRHAAAEIADGDGIVSDFDYDEDVEEYTQNIGYRMHVDRTRYVTLELTFILPE